MLMSKDKQVEEVVKLRDEDNLTFEQIGDRLGFSDRTARRRYNAGILQQQSQALTEEGLDTFPKVGEGFTVSVESDFVPDDKEPIECFEPLERTGDALITADYHIPLHDPGLINTMIECAKKNDIKQLIIAGDYWNMDSLSSYLPHQPEAAFNVEREDGNVIMKTLLRTFDSIDMIWGNHDFRLTKSVGFKHSFTECMKWAFGALTEEEMSKIRFSDLDYMYYMNNDDVYRVCHPTNFSSIPLSVPRRLALKYASGVISAHSHHLSMGVAPNGIDIIMEAGGFFDKNRTEYIQKTTAHHEWTPGFILFKNGTPSLISPVFGTDEPYR